MAYYKLVKLIIDILALEKVILNIVFEYNGILHSIVSNQSSVFIIKIQIFLYYFSNIKCQLFTILYL